MQILWQDLRFGARMLIKQPSLALVAIITLALGIGANTAIFSVVNGVLLRPLPYPSPEQIVRLFERVDRETMSSDRMEVAPANYFDWQSQSRSFSGISVWGAENLPLAGDSEAENVASAFVSANFFSVLNVQPMLGRTFTAEEDRPESEYVTVLSHSLWQNRYGGDRSVIGRKVILDGHTYEVIGVMPPGFHFPGQTLLWTPLALNANQVKMREAHFLKAVARLKPEVSIEQSRGEMNAIAARLAEAYPQTNRNWSVNVVSLLDEEVGKVRRALWVLLGVVGLVLLIACANVANLLLARATGRLSEIAIRVALGASRFQIIRQLLTESLIIASAGGLAGLLLALWVVEGLLALAPDNLPRVTDVRLDSRVLGFTLIVSILTGIIFGLIPALQASKTDLNTSLKEGSSKASASGKRNRALNTLIVAEIALSLVVLVSAGLLINSFFRVRQVDSGLNVDNVLTVQFTPPSAKYNDRTRWRENRLNFYGQLIPLIEASPGVESVGGIDSLPLSGRARVYRFRKDGEEHAGLTASYQVAMTNYFQSVGMRLKRGRWFTENDRDGTPPVVIINENMARRFWPSEDSIGKRIVIRNEQFAREIIGVVNDVKHFGLDKNTEPEMYVPFNQVVIDLIPLVIRTRSDPAQLISAIRQHVHAVDQTVAISKIRTMEQIASESVAQQRFTTLLLSIFAAVALVLAAVGIYGVMAYSIAQRTHEIGIRMTLGAQRSDILRLVITQGMRAAIVGVIFGLAGAIALTRVMKNLLFEVSPTDLTTFVVVSLVLAVIALLACYLPARRATKVDPVIALRYE